MATMSGSNSNTERRGVLWLFLYSSIYSRNHPLLLVVVFFHFSLFWNVYRMPQGTTQPSAIPAAVTVSVHHRTSVLCKLWWKWSERIWNPGQFEFSIWTEVFSSVWLVAISGRWCVEWLLLDSPACRRPEAFLWSPENQQAVHLCQLPHEGPGPAGVCFWKQQLVPLVLSYSLSL